MGSRFGVGKRIAKREMRLQDEESGAGMRRRELGGGVNRCSFLLTSSLLLGYLQLSNPALFPYTSLKQIISSPSPLF